ncbi:MAG: hypothetical protein ACKV19_29310 [Verrucomicrobiales bacterium]
MATSSNTAIVSCFRWSQIISNQTNDDGTVDNVSVAVGVASHLGHYTAVEHTHLLAPVYDPASNSLIFFFTVTRTTTAANGDQWNSEGEGTTIVPLDAGFAPLPPPWAFSGTYQHADGSVFHGTFQGLDFGDGPDPQNGPGPRSAAAPQRSNPCTPVTRSPSPFEAGDRFDADAGLG